MANINGLYDHDAEVPGDFEVFPAGKYTTELTESDIVATKAGTGKLFKYKARITAGEYEDRLIFGQMNLQNPNPTATKIGQGEFRALREVVGVPSPEDTQDLHFRQFEAVVKVTPATEKYKAKNEIDWAKTYKLFQGEDVKVEESSAPANDNAAPETKTANDNKAASKPAGSATKKSAWPRKGAA